MKPGWRLRPGFFCLQSLGCHFYLTFIDVNSNIVDKKLMIFNTKNSIAKKVATAIENSFRAAFVQSEYLKNGKFKPPFGFWLDPYVIGFTHVLAALFMKFEFGSDRWSPTKKGMIISLVLQNICGDDWRQFLNLANEFASAKNKNPEYERGGDDATTLYAAAMGRLRADNDNPVVVEARSLANSSHDELEALGLAKSHTASIAAFVSMLTIGKHISERYLEDDSLAKKPIT